MKIRFPMPKTERFETKMVFAGTETPVAYWKLCDKVEHLEPRWRKENLMVLNTVRTHTKAEALRWFRRKNDWAEFTEARVKS